MDLIDVAYTIDNFELEMLISVIFSTFPHFCNTQTELHHFGKFSHILLFMIFYLSSFVSFLLCLYFLSVHCLCLSQRQYWKLSH